MKSKKVLMSVILASLFFACNKSSKADTLRKKPELLAENTSSAQETVRNMLADSIDLSKLPFNEKELAAFPVFNPPADIVPLNKPLTRDFDRLFFPTREGMVPVEGKVYKAFLTSVTGKEWSLPYFEKSYKDLITAAGGMLIFQGRVPQKELDRIKDEATYFGEEGSIDYTNNLVKVYAIRRKEGDHIFVQISGYSAGGSIQILQLPKADKSSN
ncbi:hypothetical protein LXM25_15675 [Dyadobacter sp. LJ53]|uniref:hypothetical protein n=1 Tax=Dyadobacter chenwenxiniae TaxID=2906456 RepID=UPI001F3E24D4|nr:hypothetical protein [Dyadobacter chenwenxiniae]MCF0051507.1 hypothetical protein [Dyadobacter chenwenxiniae]